MSTVEIKNIPKEKFFHLDSFFTSKEKERDRTRDISKINTIVLHWTAGGSIENDYKTLKNKEFGYHFLIEKNGIITQGDKLNQRVPHAGDSFGPLGLNVNDYSIGISFVMLGLKENKEYEQFTEIQIKAVINLIDDLKLALPGRLRFITGHHFISPGRKVDPFTFPFHRIVKSNQLKLWKTGDFPYKKNISDIRFDKNNLSEQISDIVFLSDLETT